MHNGYIRKAMLFAVLFVSGLMAGNARAVVVDFDGLPFLSARQTISIGTSYEEDGFRITAGLLAYFTSASDDVIASRPALFGNLWNTEITLRQINGNPFTLHSIDLAELDHLAKPTVTFTGLRSDHSIVTQSFDLDGSFPLLSLTGRAETFSFSAGFTDLLSVSWFQGPAGPSFNRTLYSHQFDNIVVTPASQTLQNVPVSGGIGLFVLGFAVLTGFMRQPGRI